jgi:hypothetical protein
MALWIMAYHDTPDKPEIRMMAKRMGLMDEHIYGCCMRLWIYADAQTTDGFIPYLDAADVDRIVRLPGLANEMAAVGWLKFEDGGVTLPRFTEKHSDTAKAREHAARRKRDQREREEAERLAAEKPKRKRVTKECDTPVTEPCDQRKGEESISTSSLGSASTAKQKAAEAAVSLRYVNALSEEWKPAVKAVRSTKATLANWAIQTAAENGYTPGLVCEVVAFARKHKKQFKNPEGAVIIRLTTVGPEVPASEQWSAKISAEVPKIENPEILRKQAIDRLIAERGLSPADAAEIFDSQTLPA